MRPMPEGETGFMTGRKIRNMEEFAEVSGISRPTVSKYFNDPDSVRKSTRARIESALEQYDYRPNIFAINQNRKLTKNIGIVVPYLADPFFAEIARNLEMLVIAVSVPQSCSRTMQSCATSTRRRVR